MFKVGDKVKIVRLPYNNQIWCIPDRLINYIGVITKVHSILGIGKCYRIEFEEDGYRTWNVPRYDEPEFEIIRLAAVNKWNPLNYRSHFEPLKLP